MYFIFYWILLILVLLLSYVIYNIYMNVMFETFQNNDGNNQPTYDLTQDSTALDSRFDIFKDSNKYIKAPISNKCFKKQYSRRLLNPENKILPQIYFSETNKSRSRIINVDIFKKNVLDKVINKYNNESLNNLKYKEAKDPKLSYFENMEFTVVNEDFFDNIINKLKQYIDGEFQSYIQTLSDTSADIKCKKDMSDCETYIWKPGIIQIRENENYYEYTIQFTYYIQNKAFAYVLISKCYIEKISNSNSNSNKLHINKLNIIGLEQEQNIMLTPGFSKTQLDNKVNIFHDYPYTPYEANMTYYRSSDEDTFIRDLFKGDELKINEESIQEKLNERDQLQIELTQNPAICMTKDGDVLNYSTKEECESAVDSDGNPKESAIFDNKCEQDNDCPFYLGNINYENARGGCKEDGFCELPVNVKSISYKDYNAEDTFYPYCYGCPTDKMDTCCEIQKKILNGNATTEEIEDHGLIDINLESPDYAFENDFEERLKFQTELNKKNIEVN